MARLPLPPSPAYIRDVNHVGAGRTFCVSLFSLKFILFLLHILLIYSMACGTMARASGWRISILYVN